MKIKRNTSLNPKAKYIRLYRQFKIFYKNLYGRIGLIILIGFIVITLLTPVIVIDPNYGSLAPVIDTSSPQLEYMANLSSQNNFSFANSSLYFLPTSDYNSIGANQLLLSSQTGNLYSICIDAQNASNNNRMYEIYSQNSSNGLRVSANPVLSTLQDCSYISTGILKLTNFVFLPMSNGNIVVGQS